MTRYLKITIDAPASLEEELTMLLFDYGATGVAIDDPAAIKAHLEQGHWDASVYDAADLKVGRVTLCSVLTADRTGRAAAEALGDALAAKPGVIFCCGTLPQLDWQKKWKEAFVAHPLGDKLWLRPVWDETPVPVSRVAVVIEPGMAFGTGDHATTAMMLELTEKYLNPGCGVLDMGCGSGILAIAAIKLGAGAAAGVDIDPLCTDVVAHHCQINGIAPDDFTFYLGNILADTTLRQRFAAQKSGLILANINAECVCALCATVASFMEAGGLFLCSGILSQDEQRAKAAFAAAGLAVAERQETAGWLAFALAPEVI